MLSTTKVCHDFSGSKIERCLGLLAVLGSSWISGDGEATWLSARLAGSIVMLISVRYEPLLGRSESVRMFVSRNC